MNVVLAIGQFDINNIFYHEQVKNTVMDNSEFIRIVYSTSKFMLNGVFLGFTLTITHVEKSFNKIKCFFDKEKEKNKHNVKHLIEMELALLAKADIKNKHPVYRIGEQLTDGVVKVFNDSGKHEDFILKVYGIWENETEYGLTYKINDM